MEQYVIEECPQKLEPIPEVMSNFDHVIDREIENKLREGKYCSSYTAWNFYGFIWFEDNRFKCQINQYGKHISTLEADTIDEIMNEACTNYGSD
ncbi:MAG: hypothetical protein WC998_01575 [Candidatus Paceibacterota bacterium]|jgi:hypothetical protein